MYQNFKNREYGIFCFLKAFMSDFGRSPTRKEIAKAFKLTPQAVDYHIKNLFVKGLIKLQKNKKRNIRIKDLDYFPQKHLLT